MCVVFNLCSGQPWLLLYMSMSKYLWVGISKYLWGNLGLMYSIVYIDGNCQAIIFYILLGLEEYKEYKNIRI